MTAQWPSALMNSYKSNVPVIPLEERMEMLKALRCVAIVRPYHKLEYGRIPKMTSISVVFGLKLTV